MTVLRAGQQIPIPMAEDGAVLHRRRPLRDGDGIDDLPTRLPGFTGPLAATHRPARPRVGGQPAIWAGDRLARSSAATTVRRGRCNAKRVAFGRLAARHARASASTARPREIISRFSRVNAPHAQWQ